MKNPLMVLALKRLPLRWALTLLLIVVTAAQLARASPCDPAGFFFHAQWLGDGKRFLGSGFEQSMTSLQRAAPAEVKWDLVMHSAGPRALKVDGTYHPTRYPDGPKPILLFDLYFDPETARILNNVNRQAIITPLECTTRSLHYLEQDPSSADRRRRISFTLGLNGQLRVRVADELREGDQFTTGFEMDGALFARSPR